MNKQLENILSSREVYQMMDLKQHSDLLRKIDSINQDFRESKIAFSKYWIENTYKVEGQTREYREFLITKRGCEFLAHKTTGTKGNLFTDKYMDRFSEMEQYIKEEQQPKKLSALEQLQLQNQAILEVNEKVDKIQNDMPLFKAECDELQALVKKVGVGLMGGKNAPAYKDNSLRGRVYSDMQHQLRREFGVDKYSWIKHSQFNQAKEIITNYELPTVLKNEIIKANNQVSFEEAM
ncbi:MAG: phage regulatory protein [Clostridium butyricum]|nr:phage regulatory protein [Clostridium butyricum]